MSDNTNKRTDVSTFQTATEHLSDIERREALLAAERQIVLEKALRSTRPEDIVRASELLKKMEDDKKSLSDPKSYFIDPLQFNTNVGYKDKAFSLSYQTLKRMARTPIINSIIKTRKNQIADFAEPQENKYSTGFVIRKKPIMGEEQKMSKEDRKIADAIERFLLKGGASSGWNRDDFDTFIRKIVDDSLTYDQMTFECVRDKRGKLDQFLAVDASTFRIAESYYQEENDPRYGMNGYRGVDWSKNNDIRGVEIDGYLPAYVQIYQGNKVEEFYPWELCFGVRNPSTSITANGYGVSELEDLINVVTSMLWGDEYNRRFFSQGSAPKGLLRIKGMHNESALQQFKQQWQSMISGVMQSWKTPVVEADVDWIDLQKNNRDMEYTAWMEYLIKIACAIYSIDPTEIGWDISRSSGGGLFEGSQAERLAHSKDKGLYPLLKFLQRKINKYIVEQIHPDFEFCFMGLNGMTIEQELKMAIDKSNSFMTVNEIREQYDLKPIEGGDQPNNSTFLQAKSQASAEAQKQAMDAENESLGEVRDDSEEDEDPFAQWKDEYGEDPFAQWKDEDVEETKKSETLTDIFVKAFEDFMNEDKNEE